MNGPMILLAIKTALRRHGDLDVDALAEKILDGIYFAIELEHESNSASQPAKPTQAAPASPKVAYRPPSPPQNVVVRPNPDDSSVQTEEEPEDELPEEPDPKSSLIVAPNSQEGRLVFQKKTARIPPRVPAKRVRDKRRWDIVDLNTAVHQNTQPAITVFVKGPQAKGQSAEDIPLMLHRNVVNVMDLSVKLLYKPEGFRDDEAAFFIFQVEQDGLDFDEAMEKIRQHAVDLYSHKSVNLPRMLSAEEIIALSPPLPSDATKGNFRNSETFRVSQLYHSRS